MNDNSLLMWLAIDAHTASNVCLILLHSLWITASISAAAWCLNRAIAHRSVESRYAICVGALMLSLLCTAWMGWSVTSNRAAQLSRAMATNASSVSAWSFAADGRPTGTDIVTDSESNVAIDAIAQRTHNGTSFGLTPGSAAERFAPWVVFTYFTGLFMMMTRLSLGIWRANRLPQRAQTIEAGPIRQILENVAAEWSLGGRILLKQTAEVAVPKIVGLLRPTILIPTAAITGLTPAELEMLLVHEAAHVRRNDIWINLLQRIAETVFFFNPFVWLLSRQISTLREYCCDDMTCRSVSLQSTVERQARSRYAMALLKVAEMAVLEGRTPLQLTALAASGRSPSELRRRISRLVGEPIRDAISLSRGGILLAAALAIAVVCVPRISQSATLAELERLGIPISTVAGADGNAFLKHVANSTGGKYYKVRNVKALPKIMQREAQRDGSLIVDSKLLNEMAVAKSVVVTDRAANTDKDEAGLVDIFIEEEGTVIGIPDGLDRDSVVKPGDTLLTLQNVELDYQIKREKADLSLLAEVVRVHKEEAGDKTLPPEARKGRAQTLSKLEVKIEEKQKALELLNEKRDALVIKSPIRGKILNYGLRRTLMNRPLRRGDQVMTIAKLDDERKKRGRDEEPNVSEILERVCNTVGEKDATHLAKIKLKLPQNHQATSYLFKDKDRFLKQLATEVDAVVTEPGFFDDLLISIKTDPNGPQIDLREVVEKQLGRRLTRVTRGADEIWAWKIEPKQEKAALATLLRFVESDPNAEALNEARDSWLLTEVEEDGKAKHTTVAVFHGHLWVASDLKLFKEVMPAFGE